MLGIPENASAAQGVTTRYKFLREGFKSQHGTHTWEIGKWYKHKGDISLCNSGFHASEEIYQAFSYVQGEILALVEVSGRSIEGNDKDVWENMRVVKAWKWQKVDSVALSIFAAELCIENYEKLYPHDSRPREAIEAAKRWLKDPTPENASAACLAAHSARSSAHSAYSAHSAKLVYSAAESAYSAYSAAESVYSAYSAYSAVCSAESSAHSAKLAYSAHSAACSALSYPLKLAAKKGAIEKICKWMDERLQVLEEIK